MSDVELKERLANIDKLQQETLKLHSDFELNRTRLKWYEITVAIALFASGIAFAKLFI